MSNGLSGNKTLKTRKCTVSECMVSQTVQFGPLERETHQFTETNQPSQKLPLLKLETNTIPQAYRLLIDYSGKARKNC